MTARCWGVKHNNAINLRKNNQTINNDEEKLNAIIVCELSDTESAFCLSKISLYTLFIWLNCFDLLFEKVSSLYNLIKMHKIHLI